jgi:predicted lipid carrier protein YhbT
MTTAREIMSDIAGKIAANAAAAAAIGAVYKFVLEGDAGGTWLVTLKGDVGVSETDAPADCTLRMSTADGIALFQGKKTGEELFFGGQLRIDGDVTLALRLQSLLAIIR